MTQAELAATLAWVALAAAVTVTYVGDRLGLGVLPGLGAAAAAGATIVLFARLRRTVAGEARALVAFLLVVGATLAYLLWLAWPALLPLGSGSDLAHHLLLVDYIERHDGLPHDASAVEFLGEMADYTPGVHLLSVIAGALSRTNGFHAIYPVVVFAVALKYGVFLLVLLRLFSRSPFRMPLAVAGVIALATAPVYTLGSFVNDSFLAQVVAELFALAAWWAFVWWEAQPGRLAMALFATAGIATFLTWPIWIGPPMLALALLLLTRPDVSWREKAAHAAIAWLPIAIVVIVHSVGRTAQVSIVSSSGAVVPPSPAVLGWWLPVLSIGGGLLAMSMRRQRSAVVFAVAIAMQAAALWLVAAGRTPYMAIKMTYLAIYPAIALALILVDVIRHRVASLVPAHIGRRAGLAAAWLAVAALGIAARHDLPVRSRMRPVVSDELASAGLWARAHVPVGCVDYLVGNEYTAYWLHLAVLGNPRISARTGNDETFLTQASMGRWLVPGSPRYAIARLTVLPAEVRGEVEIRQQYGEAAVIERRTPSACP